MINRHLIPVLVSALLVFIPSAAWTEEVTAKGFSFELKPGGPPSLVTLVWNKSSLEAIEIRSKADGPPAQRILIGEGEIVGCDLDQEDLPPGNWIGTLDFNGDGLQDIYLQVAKGSDRQYAILLYDTKSTHFVASEALASITGLDVSEGAGAANAGKSARKLPDSFGLVTKEAMKPCRLSISGPPLKKGDFVTVVRLGDEQAVYDAEIDEAVAATDMEDGALAYTLKCTPEPADEEVFVGTGVVDPINGITIDTSKVASTRVASAPPGERLHFRTCTSGEGMHLTMWSGAPLTGERVWHRYHYLGYDVEADCDPKDFQE